MVVRRTKKEGDKFSSLLPSNLVRFPVVGSEEAPALSQTLANPSESIPAGSKTTGLERETRNEDGYRWG
jgi:hypothetical protein